MGHERRIFISFANQPAVGQVLDIPPSEFHYLRDVLRMQAGDPIVVVDKDRGVPYECFIASATGNQIKVKVAKTLNTEFDGSVVHSLLFALCRGKTNEYVAEKATELGVSSIIFWGAQRSVVKVVSDEDCNRKKERLYRICEAAARQSGRNQIPEVAVFKVLEDALSYLKRSTKPHDRFFLGSLSPEAKRLPALAPLISRAHCLIGPEGDLTEEEEATLLNSSFERFSLGEGRLRAETAACAAITALDMLFEMGKSA